MPITELKLAQGLWLSNPDAMLHIDLNDPVSIENYAQICGLGLDMTSCGWRRLGAATITYHITSTPEQLATAAVDAAQQALQKLEADHQVKINALQATISKLQTLTWNGQSVQGQEEVVSETPTRHWQDVVQEESWQCVKTGCQLMVMDDGVNLDSYWGDLFYDAPTQEYLFNCANDDPSLSRYTGEDQYYISADTSEPNFTTSYAGFPRLFLFAAQEAGLSEALSTYIEGTPQ
jgi:hypothetical protein